MSSGGKRSRITFELTSDEADAVRGLLKVDRVVKNTAEKTEKLGRKGKQSFKDMIFGSGRFAQQLGGLATRFAAVSSAIEVARAAQQRLIQEREKRVDQGKEVLANERKLLQVSSSAEEFESLRNVSREFEGTGLVDKAQAVDAAFALQSKGLLENRKAFLQLTKIIGGDVNPTINSVSRILTSFGMSASRTEGLVNLLAASAVPELATQEQVGAEFARVLPGLKELGSMPEEIAALLASQISAFKSPEQASTALAALARELLRRPQLQTGQGAFADVRRLVDAGVDSREELRKLGIIESTAQDSFMQMLPVMQSIDENISRNQEILKQTGAETFLSRKEAIFQQTLGTEADASSSEARLRLAEERRGQLERQEKAFQNNVQTILEDAGVPTLARDAAGTAVENRGLLGMSLRGVADPFGISSGGMAFEIFGLLKDVFRSDQEEIAVRQKENTDALVDLKSALMIVRDPLAPAFSREDVRANLFTEQGERTRPPVAPLNVSVNAE